MSSSLLKGTFSSENGDCCENPKMDLKPWRNYAPTAVEAHQENEDSVSTTTSLLS